MRARAFAAVGVALGLRRVCPRRLVARVLQDGHRSGVRGRVQVGRAPARRGCRARAERSDDDRDQHQAKDDVLRAYAGYATALNIALNFLLIPPFGMVGCRRCVVRDAPRSQRLVLLARATARPDVVRPRPCSARSRSPVLRRDRELDQPRQRVAERARQLPLVLLYPLVVWRSAGSVSRAPLFRRACASVSVSVLHLGNVAQNGYNNAKLLRRLGLEHVRGLRRGAGAGAARVGGRAATPGDRTRWRPGRRASRSTAGTRPPWVIAPRAAPRRRPRGWYRLAYAIALAAAMPRLERTYLSLRDHFEPLRDTLGCDLTLDDVIAGFRATWMQSTPARRPPARCSAATNSSRRTRRTRSSR